MLRRASLQKRPGSGRSLTSLDFFLRGTSACRPHETYDSLLVIGKMFETPIPLTVRAKWGSEAIS